jgi:hypothetical protein
MNFSEALTSIKEGKVMGRAEWKNAKGVFLVAGSEFEVNRAPLLGILPAGTKVTYRPHIDMRGADDTIGTWAPSMVDILAEDWQEVVA